MFIERIKLSTSKFKKYSLKNNAYRVIINKSMYLEIGKITIDKVNEEVIFENIEVHTRNFLIESDTVIDFLNDNLSDILIDNLME